MTRRRPTIGEQIIGGLREAVAFERGEVEARVDRLAFTARDAHAAPAPAYSSERIATLRGKLRLSQPIFAQALNVSPNTVRAWEQGKREPDGAALRLLQIAEAHPQWVLDAVRDGRAAARPKARATAG